jgi:ubiquinone/menaquinone biosynthesis C-methylase UbiE
LPNNASVLDIGCGWGNLSLSLARNFATVYALDLVPERAVMASIRAREAGLANVIALAGGNAAHLPFPDASLDVVVLNGVLEWVPVSFPQIADPREAQLRLLRDVARVLKPDGQLYIGIENRLGYAYFLGKPDEHSKLKYATLLPRNLANRYSLAKRHQPYRTYTYGWRGYRKLLHDAGFATSRFYCPFPEYREFSELIDLNRAQNLARALYPTSFLGRLGMQLCKRVNLFREFSPTYSIVASKARELDRFVDRLLHHIGGGASADIHLRITQTPAALIFTSDTAIKLPLTARTDTRLGMEMQNLQFASTKHRRQIPELLAAGTLQDQRFLAMRRLDGVPGGKYLLKREHLPDVVRAAVAFVTQLHSETLRRQVCTDEWLQAHFDPIVDGVSRLGVELSALKDECRRELAGRTVLTVMSHGDFTVRNLLINPRNLELVGVVDWDLAEIDGWPLEDLLQLLTANEYLTRGNYPGEALTGLLRGFHAAGSFEQQLLAGYLSAIRAEPLQIKWASQRFLLRNIVNKAQHGDNQTEPLLRTLETDLATIRDLAENLES